MTRPGPQDSVLLYRLFGDICSPYALRISHADPCDRAGKPRSTHAHDHLSHWLVISKLVAQITSRNRLQLLYVTDCLQVFNCVHRQQPTAGLYQVRSGSYPALMAQDHGFYLIWRLVSEWCGCDKWDCVAVQQILLLDAPTRPFGRVFRLFLNHVP